jgi:hypothetical protein
MPCETYLGNGRRIVTKLNQNSFNCGTYQNWLEISHVDLIICVNILEGHSRAEKTVGNLTKN